MSLRQYDFLWPKRKLARAEPYLIDCRYAASWRRQVFSVRNHFNFFTIHQMDKKSFPEIEGGGSLILAWQIRNKRVLVVGGGEASQI